MKTSPTAPPALTRRQRAVLQFIRTHIDREGYPPTVREIGDHMHIRSPNGIMCHLKALENRGKITRTHNCSRAIRLCEPTRKETNVTRGSIERRTARLLESMSVVQLRGLVTEIDRRTANRLKKALK